MRLLTKFLTSCILIFLSLSGVGQGFINELVDKVSSYSDSIPVEKVYLHLDRPFYFAGDTIWYKAYAVDADLNPTLLSSVLHVDWIAPSGKLVEHQRIRMEDGEAQGDFNIPVEIADGEFHVRAYTNGMRNQDEAFLFTKSFTLLNPLAKTNRNTLEVLPSIDLQFFPEGGEMIPGLSTRVAFKAIAANGKSIPIQGTIVDDLDKVITRFQSQHKGMGVFELLPEPGRSYKAMLIDGRSYPLPVAAQTGIVLHVSNLDEVNILVRIEGTRQLTNQSFYLVGQSHGQVSFHSRFTLNAGHMDIIIPKSDFPPGILQLTVFDATGLPFAERMVFVYPSEKLQLEITPDQENYDARESVTLDLHVKDQQGRPVVASLSLSVTDASAVTQTPFQRNIMTDFLLQSDLKGEIEDPAWYFESGGRDRNFALDLVMMTHGWRKFDWTALMKNPVTSPAFPLEGGLTISGKIINKETQKPAANAQAVMITGSVGSGNFFTASTDEKGRFLMQHTDFTDSTTQVWKVEDKKGRLVDAEIILDKPDSNIPTIDFEPMYNISMDQKREQVEILKKNRISTGLWNPDSVRMLDEVIIKDKRIPGEKPLRVIGAGSYAIYPKKGDYAYEPGRLVRQIPGLIIYGGGGTMQIMGLGSQRYGHVAPNAYNQPWVIVDGIVNSDLTFMNTLQTSRIEKMEFLTGNMAAFYCSQTESTPMNPRPVFVIHLKKFVPGQKEQQEMGMGISVLYAQGYHLPRIFYSPKYQPDHIAPEIKDHRLTIFWEPVVKTDQEGNARVTFYNTDSAGNFNIIVEGMAGNHPIHQMHRVGQATEPAR